MKELQERELIVKEFAKVSHRLDGEILELDGSNLTLREIEVSRV